MFCPNPFELECHPWPECWNCSEILAIADAVFESYNSNGDAAISSLDNIDESHLDFLIDNCDFNNDDFI
jgi:hypothetical protein